MRTRLWPMALGLAMISAVPALADPFAQISDRRFRQDIQMMKAAGLIRGPIDSWPMAWAHIDQGLDAAHDGRAMAPHLAAAVARVEALSDLAKHDLVIDLRANVTNAPAVARDFNGTARQKFEGSAAVDVSVGAFSANLGVAVADGQLGRDYDLSPSQVAVVVGNWALYGGYTQQWFGPGEDGALLFSNSARSFPKFGIKRLVPYTINLPVLRWLGPVSFEIFGGVLNEQRDYPNQFIVGTRLSFAPTERLTIGLNRMQQLCGQGRPCSLSVIGKSFIGFGNADNPTPGNQAAFFAQAGNQIAGWDISYTRQFGQVTGKVYVEAEAEDSQNVLLEQYSRLLGTIWTGPIGSHGASWQFGAEYTNTIASQLFQGTFLKGTGNLQYRTSTYNNSLYYSGFTYRSRPIGFWTDGDSTNFVFSAALTDALNRRWYGSVRAADINSTNLGFPPTPVFLPGGTRQGTISYRVSGNNEKINIFTGGVLWPTALGDITLEGRFQTDSPNTPGIRDRQAQIEFGYRGRF